MFRCVVLPICLLVSSASAVSSEDLHATREGATRSHLQSLLSTHGLDARTAPRRPRTWRRVDLDWSRPGGADVRQKREAYSERGLTIRGEQEGRMEPAVRRALELSENELLVVGTDAKRQVRWWTSIADPRVVRYETGDEDGNLIDGGIILRGDVQFSVEMPDDPEIGSVEIFHPRWTGAAFELESVAVVGRTAR